MKDEEHRVSLVGSTAKLVTGVPARMTKMIRFLWYFVCFALTIILISDSIGCQVSPRLMQRSLRAAYDDCTVPITKKKTDVWWFL